MKEKDKTKKQLLNELIELRKQVTEIKSPKKEHAQGEKRRRDFFKAGEGTAEKNFDLAEISLVGIYKTNIKGDILYVNDVMVEMFGYKSQREMMKAGVRRGYKNPKDRDVLIKKLKKEGKVYNYEMELLTKKGVPKKILLSAVLEGDIILGMFMDLTEHLKVEDSLKVSEEKYRNLVESSTDMIFVVDRRSNMVMDVNKAVCKNLGYSRDEIIGSRAGSRIADSDRDIFKKEFIKHKDVGSFSGEFNLRRKDGTMLPVEVLGSAHSDYLFAFARDITERYQAEKLLRDSEEKFKSLAEHSPNMIFINRKGKVVYANKQCENIMGYSRDEFYSTDFDFFSLIVPEHMDVVRENFRRHMRGEEVAPHEYVLITKEGKKVDTIITTRLFNYEGENAILGIVTDITGRKKLEAELLKSQKMESLGLLAGGIAHTFNNILTAIDGNISLAKMYAMPGLEIYDLLAEAEKASLRAKNLVQQLLSFSKGGMPLKKVISVTRLIQDTVSFALSGSSDGCEFDFEDDLSTIEADRDQIAQVINSFILYAQRSMYKGGIIIVSSKNTAVSAETQLPLKIGKYIRISIQYKCPKISAENLQKLFDPYLNTENEDFGFGLASAFSIIKKHEGHIAVESKSKTGTTFSIYLPAVGKKISSEDSEDRVSVYRRGQGTILVMDDEEIIRNVLARMLLQCGYEGEFAKDGEEAVALYEKAKAAGQFFDAVILDLIVPKGMGGKETVKKLLNIDPDVKAIVSSGYSHDPVVAEFRKYGFSSFLSKPYKLEELCKTLNMITQKTSDNF
jgi:PAS domain S-box-containing protein